MDLRNDLRRGNVVKIENTIDFITQIGSRNLNTTLFSGLEYEEVTPLKLSEDLLLKCGFTKSKNNRPLYDSDVFKIEMNYYKALFCVYWYERNDMGNISKGFRCYIESDQYGKIEFSEDIWIWLEGLHDLQNIFYMLNAKKELSINIALLNQ